MTTKSRARRATERGLGSCHRNRTTEGLHVTHAEAIARGEKLIAVPSPRHSGEAAAHALIALYKLVDERFPLPATDQRNRGS